MPSPSDAGSFWSGRRVFITGAAGFVGSWLSEALRDAGAHVTGLVWPMDADAGGSPPVGPAGIDVVHGRVEDAPTVERVLRDSRPDTVFHLAAVNVNVGTGTPPTTIFETNIRGTWCVLEACRLTPSVERIVVASSREAENGGRRRHPYQVSKMAAELVARSYSDTYGLPVAISRSDNVYGGRDLNWHRLIPGTLRALLGGEAPVLRSDGTLARDYVHVDDIVRAYMALGVRAGEAGVRGEVFHFATGTSTSALEIVRQLCELTDRAGLMPIVQEASTGERVNQPRSTARESDLLGWTSHVGIHEGLRSTVDWYRAYLNRSAASH